MNAYVWGTVTEQVWTTVGPGFDKDSIKTLVFVRAYHGLKSARFRSHLTRYMESMVWVLDLWLKPETRPDQKMGCSITHIYCVMWMTYFLSIIVHMVCFSTYTSPSSLSPGFGGPDVYLGAKLCKTRLHNVVSALAMSPIKYVHEAVRAERPI